MADYYQDVYFHNKIISTCDDGPQITRQDLIDAIYKWDGENWAPEGFALGSSFTEFNGVYTEDNQTKSQSANIFVALLTDSNYDPILVADQGFVVKKDLSVGGFLSTNQGEIWIGHGRNSSTDTPRIALMHSGQGYNKLYLTMADCSTPAHLDLSCLNVHGYIDVGTSQDGISRFILIQGPNNNGQTATLKLIDDYNFVRATFGGSTTVQSYNDIELKSGNGAYTATFGGSSGAWNFNANCGVAGNGAFSTSSAITSGYLTGGGTRAVYSTSGGTLTNTASSQRYKQNIETLTESSWLYNLRPVTFDWKDYQQAKSDGRQIGFIAEEVYAINPQLAWLNKEGEPEGVHYEKLCVPIIAELQKLRAEVDDLKAKLAAA